MGWRLQMCGASPRSFSSDYRSIPLALDTVTPRQSRKCDEQQLRRWRLMAVARCRLLPAACTARLQCREGAHAFPCWLAIQYHDASREEILISLWGCFIR